LVAAGAVQYERKKVGKIQRKIKKEQARETKNSYKALFVKVETLEKKA
jgi:hypothetical protein